MDYYSVRSDKTNEATVLAKQIRAEYDKESPDYNMLADMAANLADVVLDLEPELIGR